MNRLDAALRRARDQNRAALIGFITGGDPDLETTLELIPELEAAGLDVLELGMPHSDPIGEGPTIQAASSRSLAHKTTPRAILDVARRAREVSQIPLVLMGYLNNVLARGEDAFVKDCAEAGIDALIVADTPYEETPALNTACETHGVHRILLVAPTTTPLRVVQIAARSRGFVYCVATTGVTGERKAVPEDLEQLVARIRRVTDTPVCVGFGISTPEHAAVVARIADGVIVGSALVARVGTAPTPAESVRRGRAFVEALAAGVRAAR